MGQVEHRRKLIAEKVGRIRRGKARAALAERLQGTLGVVREDDFLPVEESEKVARPFFERLKVYPDSSRRWWRRHDGPKVFELLRRLRTRFANREVLLFAGSKVEVLRLPIDRLLLHPEAVFHELGDDLSFATPDLGSGFCLELSYQDSTGKFVRDGVYELSAWGEFEV